MEIIVLTGLQASGKSTFSREKFSADYVIVNLDTLKTRYQEDKLIAECIEAGKSFVVDNTNVSLEHRAKYINIAKKNNCKLISYYIPVSKEEAVKRNSLREGTAKVHRVAIYTTNKKLIVPTKEEGFDELYVVDSSEEGYTIKRV